MRTYKKRRNQYFFILKVFPVNCISEIDIIHVNFKGGPKNAGKLLFVYDFRCFILFSVKRIIFESKWEKIFYYYTFFCANLNF